MANNVNNKGRIYYIEPNNLTNAVNNEYGSDNVTYNQEDYSISIDLQVITPDRNDCGTIDYASKIRNVNISNDNTYVSFFEGSTLKNNTTNKEYKMLTTSYTETSYNDLKDNVDNKEVLGVEYIDISFDSWFYPRVNMKFVDVRGFSLMTPEEIAYRNDLIKEQNGSNAKEALGSFFKSLFMFPYPIFLLKVKGFYGNAVTFSLTVEDFKASFNADNGNFEIIVNFIGYMYGLYTDLPMKYVAVSPYDKYAGKDYWIKSNFKFDNGDKIPTFIEFMEKVDSANDELAKLSANNINIKNYKLYTQQIDSINEIINAFDVFVSDMGGGLNTKIVGKDNIMILGFTDEDGKKYAKVNRDSLKALINKINTHNSKDWGKISIPNGDIDSNSIYECKKLYSILKNDSGIEYIWPNYLVSTDEIYNDETVKEWRERIDSDSAIKLKLRGTDDNGYENSPAKNNKLNGCYVYLYKTDSFKEKLKSKVDELISKQKKLNEAITEDLNNTSKNILGFTPSIKNIFKMLFAHVDTFFHSVYSCMQAIKDDNRLSSDLDINLNQTDIKSNVKSNVFIPPFPLITKKDDSKEIEWPGNIPSLANMEEISLINGIFEGTINCAEKLDNIESNLLANSKNEYIPVNMTDLAMGYNPYKYIYENTNSTIKIDELMTHFALRAINYLSYENKKSKNGTYFGEVDAYNYYMSHQTYDESLMNILSSSECSGDEFIKFIKQTDNNILYNSEETNKPLFLYNGTNKYIINNNKYRWIISNNIELLPVNFRSLSDIKSNIDRDNTIKSMYLTLNNDLSIDDDNNELTNRNIFDIYESSDSLISLKNSIKEKDYEFISDKDLLCSNWNLDLNDYDRYYSTNESISFKNKYTNNDIKRNSNLIPLNEDISSGLKIFQINPISKNAFFSELNGISQGIVANYANKELSLNDIFLPTLQMGKNSSLYGHPFFYLQNDGNDLKLINYRKSFLFLHSLPFSKDSCKEFIKTIKSKDNGKIERVPRSLCLFAGALLWRERYVKLYKEDCFATNSSFYLPKGEESYKFLLTDSESYSINIQESNNIKDYKKVEDYFKDGNGNLFTIRPEIKNLLINYFESWTNDSSKFGFVNLNNEFELKLIDDNNNDITLTYSTFTTLVKMWSCYTSEINGNSIGKNKENTFKRYYESIFGTQASGSTILTLIGLLNDKFSKNFAKNYMKIALAYDLKSFILMFRYGSLSVTNLSEFFLSDISLYIMRNSIERKSNMFSDINTNIDINSLKDSFESFKKTLLSLYEVESRTKISNETNKVSSLIDSELKLSCYLTLKNLYDRWLCSNKNDRWELNSNGDTEFKNFIFIDSYYNDIGDKLIVNCDVVYNILKQCYDVESSTSVYEFLSEVAEQSRLLFLAIPIFNNFKNAETLYELFTPISTNSSKVNDINSTSTYVCMYMYEPSHILDVGNEIGDYKYTSDGFDLADTLGNIYDVTDSIPKDMLEKNDYCIPAFGVTYSKQNQNFFKRIDVNMDNPQVTEYSIGTLLNISKKNVNNQKLAYTGQNLYKIYSNHSYTCKVEMMGCASLMPMMYFQLNNIPLFKGAYIITNVSHHIEAGNMTTTFVGVRQSKNKLSLNTSVFTTIPFSNQVNGTSTNDSYIQNNDEVTDSNLYINNFSGYKSEYSKPANDDSELAQCDYCYDNVSSMKDKNGLPLIIFSYADLNASGGAKKTFDELTYNMRKLIVDIAKTVDANTNYKLRITSLRRYGNGNSDHDKGCAADLHGCEVNKNGDVIDGKKYSSNLFDLIATTFTPYIKQLIWENSGTDYTIYNSDYVNNCIHLSSYGYDDPKNAQIFQARLFDGNYNSIPILDKDDLFPLSKSFLATCSELIANNVISMKNLNNFVLSNMIDDESKEKLLTYKINRNN